MWFFVQRWVYIHHLHSEPASSKIIYRHGYVSSACTSTCSLGAIAISALQVCNGQSLHVYKTMSVCNYCLSLLKSIWLHLMYYVVLLPYLWKWLVMIKRFVHEGPSELHISRVILRLCTRSIWWCISRSSLDTMNLIRRLICMDLSCKSFHTSKWTKCQFYIYLCCNTIIQI